MSKKKNAIAATATAPTAPDNSGAAAAAETPAKKKPSLESRVEALEVKTFGHAPHAPAGE